MSRPGDPRMGELFLDAGEVEIIRVDRTDKRVGIGMIYFPHDEGTIRNGGRAGAKKSPSVVKELLKKFGSVINPAYGDDLRESVYLVEIGEAEGQTLEDAHLSLGLLVKQTIMKGLLPMIIGGSNDQSYPNANAWITNKVKDQEFAVINVDAHLDVRPYIEGEKRHSGSPFYELLNDSRFPKQGTFVEFAAQGHQCSQQHADFVTNTHGQKIVWLDTMRDEEHKPHHVFYDLLQNDYWKKRQIFVSFDLDSIQAAVMPGVSCPSAVGLTADEAAHIAYYSGQNSNVSLIDFSELNVEVEGDRSPRMLALLIYNFLMGVAARDIPEPAAATTPAPATLNPKPATGYRRRSIVTMPSFSYE